jgi:hypothetical protein
MAWSFYQRQSSLLGDQFDKAVLIRELEGYVAGLSSLGTILDQGGTLRANAGALREWKAENGQPWRSTSRAKASTMGTWAPTAA